MHGCTHAWVCCCMHADTWVRACLPARPPARLLTYAVLAHMDTRAELRKDSTPGETRQRQDRKRKPRHRQIDHICKSATSAPAEFGGEINVSRNRARTRGSSAEVCTSTEVAPLAASGMIHTGFLLSWHFTVLATIKHNSLICLCQDSKMPGQ